MNSDRLIYLFCVLLIAVGAVFGHSFAVFDNSFFAFLSALSSGWIQFFAGVLVSCFFQKCSAVQANRQLRAQELTSQGVSFSIEENDKKEPIGLSLQAAMSESFSTSNVPTRILKKRKVDKPL